MNSQPSPAARPSPERPGDPERVRRRARTAVERPGRRRVADRDEGDPGEAEAPEPERQRGDGSRPSGNSSSATPSSPKRGGARSLQPGRDHVAARQPRVAMYERHVGVLAAGRRRRGTRPKPRRRSTRSGSPARRARRPARRRVANDQRGDHERSAAQAAERRSRRPASPVHEPSTTTQPRRWPARRATASQRSRLAPQPQRHVCGLHRLAHDAREVGAQRVEVDLLAQPRAERLERAARRRSGGGRSAGRPAAASRDRSGRNSAATTSVETAIARFEPPANDVNSLTSSTSADVRGAEHRGQRAVDQRPVDDDVDVVEPVAQDRDARSRPAAPKTTSERRTQPSRSRRGRPNALGRPGHRREQQATSAAPAKASHLSCCRSTPRGAPQRTTATPTAPMTAARR